MKIECKWCNYWFLYHSCHIFTHSGGWVYLKDRENIIFFILWKVSARYHGCEFVFAAPLCFSVYDWNITAARFLSRSSKKISRYRRYFLWNIQLWSLTYLKIVIREEENESGQSGCCLKHLNLFLSFTPTFVALQLPLSPLLSLTPKYLFSSLCSTCSDFGKADVFSWNIWGFIILEIYINWRCQWDVFHVSELQMFLLMPVHQNQRGCCIFPVKYTPH